MRPILDEKNLLKHMKSFYTITRCKVVVFDTDFNEIFAYPTHHCSFCQRMHSAHPGQCDISGTDFCKKSSSISGLYIGKCYAGLTEAVFPLIQNNITVGYIMFGQVFTQLSPSIKNNSKNSLFTPNDKITTKTIDEIHACADILQALAHFITLKGMITPPPADFAIKIKNYIDNNLSDDLTSEALSKKFMINRTDLYNITAPYMPGGILQYIIKARLDKAKELLITTDMGVRAIAEAVGYDDYNYFCKCFKKNFDIAPTKLRKNSKTE